MTLTDELSILYSARGLNSSEFGYAKNTSNSVFEDKVKLLFSERRREQPQQNINVP